MARSRAEAAAAAAVRRSQLRRKTVAIIAVIGVIALLVVGVVVAVGDDPETVATGDSSTTTALASSTTAAPESAAGKPCVEVAEPLPAGAPDVPVGVGPPPTDLVVTDITPGTGATVGATDTLTVHYIGVSCSTGFIFDSSYERGEPATFSLTGVIPGWQEGLAGMQAGGTRLLGIPPDQAYGSAGSPPDIAPDETLWFVVEVLEATPAG